MGYLAYLLRYTPDIDYLETYRAHYIRYLRFVFHEFLLTSAL